MIYFILIISIALYAFLPQSVLDSVGVCDGNLAASVYYMYAHASWLHLIINVVSMLLIWFPIRNLYVKRYNSEPHQLHVATYFAAVLAGLICASSTPTVGMSGCVFFLLGCLLALNPTKKQLLNYVWIVLTIAVQYFFGKSNVALHVCAFLEGIVFICVRELFHQYRNKLGLFAPAENEDC